MAVLAAACAAVATSGSGSPATFPGAAGKIVVSSRGFGSGAELVNPDGSGRTSISIPGGYHPVWSADGKWLAYSNFPEPWVIRVASAGGTGDREVVSKGAADPVSTPDYAWSPSGSEIAYPCPSGLCAVRVADGVTRRVIDLPAPSRASSPRWSPDGSRISFGCTFIAALCLVRPDGSDPVGYTATGGLAIGFPDWSPDGRQLVFTNRGKVYTLDLDDGEVRQLADLGGVTVVRARWSPDGTSLLLTQFPSIHVLRLDESAPTKIGEGGQADWGTSPAVTVPEMRFEPRWVLSRQAGRIVLAGTASHAASLTVALRTSRKAYPPRTTTVPAGAYTTSVALPADVLPGSYEVVVGGTSGSERLLDVSRTASLAAPVTGLVSRSSIVAARGGRRLTARFSFSVRPASGRRPTAVWVAPSGAVRLRQQLSTARVVTSSLASQEPLVRGRWRCRLEVGGTALAVVSVRVG